MRKGVALVGLATVAAVVLGVAAKFAAPEQQSRVPTSSVVTPEPAPTGVTVAHVPGDDANAAHDDARLGQDDGAPTTGPPPQIALTTAPVPTAERHMEDAGHDRPTPSETDESPEKDAGR
jgi:hypothetical protein